MMNGCEKYFGVGEKVGNAFKDGAALKQEHVGT